jgi:hypothetical protein
MYGGYPNRRSSGHCPSNWMSTTVPSPDDDSSLPSGYLPFYHIRRGGMWLRSFVNWPQIAPRGVVGTLSPPPDSNGHWTLHRNLHSEPV